MQTRAQIRNQIRVLLGETDSANSNFSDTELNEYVNESQRYLATFIEYPRDLFEVTTEDGVGAYNLPTDCIKLLNVYFGNVAIAGDNLPLRVVTEETLKGLYPNWMDESASSKGQPKFALILDRRTIAVYPRPDSTFAGKKLMVKYLYNPAALGDDTSTPEVPAPFDDVLQFYAAHLCYIGKLHDMEKGIAMLKIYDNKVKSLMPILTKESEELLQFTWGATDSVNDSDGFNILL